MIVCICLRIYCSWLPQFLQFGCLSTEDCDISMRPASLLSLVCFAKIKLSVGLITGAVFRYGVNEKKVSTQLYNLRSANANDYNVPLPPEKAILNLTLKKEVADYRFYFYSLETTSHSPLVSHSRVGYYRCFIFVVNLQPRNFLQPHPSSDNFYCGI